MVKKRKNHVKVKRSLTTPLSVEDQREFDRLLKHYEKRTEKLIEGIRRSERMTAADYAITINAR